MPLPPLCDVPLAVVALPPVLEIDGMEVVREDVAAAAGAPPAKQLGNIIFFLKKTCLGNKFLG